MLCEVQKLIGIPALTRSPWLIFLWPSLGLEVYHQPLFLYVQPKEMSVVEAQVIYSPLIHC